MALISLSNLSDSLSIISVNFVCDLSDRVFSKSWAAPMIPPSGFFISCDKPLTISLVAFC